MKITQVWWRWGPVLGVIFLLGALAVIATSASFTATRLPIMAPSPPVPTPASTVRPTIRPTRLPQSTLAEEASRVPPWVYTAILALAAAAVISVVIAVLWTVVRRSIRVKVRSLPQPAPVAQATEDDANAMRAAVQAGINALNDDRDPRRAVIGCWVTLEALAAEAGTVRESGDTPTELIHRLLSSHRVSAQVLAEFAELYRMARYAPHVIDEDMRIRARAALYQLHVELMQTVGVS